MKFTLRQIEYFVAAAECGSITLASARRNISQPAISAAISQLEDIFGIQLFIRHHAQGLSLTSEGHQFLGEAKVLLAQAEELASTGLSLSGQIAGTLNVGCMSTLYPFVVPELLETFRKSHPAVQLNVMPAHHGALLDHLRSGRLNAVILYDMAMPADVIFEPLADLPPYVTIAADHPLATRRSISLRDLAGESFLLLDLPVSREYFLMLFKDADVTPDFGGRYDSIDVIRSLVARGNGYSLANTKPINRAALDGRKLAYLELSGNPRPLTYGIATLAGIRRTRVTDAFVAICNALLHNKPLPGAR